MRASRVAHGIDHVHRRRKSPASTGNSIGVVTAFAWLGIAFSALSNSLGDAHGVIRDVSILILLVSGLARVWPQPFEQLMTPFGASANRFSRVGAWSGSGLVAGFVLGKTFGVVCPPTPGRYWLPFLRWTPRHRTWGVRDSFSRCSPPGPPFPC